MQRMAHDKGLGDPECPGHSSCPRSVVRETARQGSDQCTGKMLILSIIQIKHTDRF